MHGVKIDGFSYPNLMYQKCKQKISPPSLLSNEKSPFNPPKDENNFLVQRDRGKL